MKALRLSGRVLSISCCAAILIAGCQASNDSVTDVSVDWKVVPDSAGAGSMQLVIGLADSLGRPIQQAGVRVEATMTHPGMQPILVEATESEPGRYESAIDLTMSGDWVLLLYVTLPDGRLLERQKEFRGVRVS